MCNQTLVFVLLVLFVLFVLLVFLTTWHSCCLLIVSFFDDVCDDQEATVAQCTRPDRLAIWFLVVVVVVITHVVVSIFDRWRGATRLAMKESRMMGDSWKICECRWALMILIFVLLPSFCDWCLQGGEQMEVVTILSACYQCGGVIFLYMADGA